MAETIKSYHFAVGDKVFAYYDGLLYEATCLERRKTDYGENQYFIHYKGFKSKWDEWSDEYDILPINQINLSHKERLESSRKSCRRSKRGKKSQEPRATEDDSSPKPALRKRGRPKKSVDQSAEPAVGQSAEPAVGQSAEPVVGQSAEPVVGQSAESAVGQSAEPVVGQSAEPVVGQSAESAVGQSAESVVGQTAETMVGQSAEPVVGQSAEPVVGQSEEPVVGQYVESVVGQSTESNTENSAKPSVAQLTTSCTRSVAKFKLNTFTIQCSKDLANELRKIVLPTHLKRAIELDRKIMHRKTYDSQKLLKFPDENFLAKVIHTYTNSSYFIDDIQKKYSRIFCVTLMQYFNASVHKHLTYRVERKHCTRYKCMEYFFNRMNDQPNIHFVYRKFLRPKKMWCYLYGPMYLLRLIVRLPKVLKSIPLIPEYDLDVFVRHIKKLIWFLEDNFNTYFTHGDYIHIEELIYKYKEEYES